MVTAKAGAMAKGNIGRRDLLRVLGASSAVCGGMAACGAGNVVPRSELVPLPDLREGKILIEVADFPELLKVGGCVVGESAGMADPVAIARDAENRFFAVRALCTHMTCILRFNALNITLDCPCHGSTFEIDGRVVTGPAQQPLRTLATRFDGTLLSVLIAA
jgi:nitrite reductase/ring-hydroxylating ferredoxin subunit